MKVRAVALLARTNILVLTIVSYIAIHWYSEAAAAGGSSSSSSSSISEEAAAAAAAAAAQRKQHQNQKHLLPSCFPWSSLMQSPDVAFLLDIDGVLVRGHNALPCACPALQAIEASGARDVT
jgi:hypothetical protein